MEYEFSEPLPGVFSEGNELWTSSLNFVLHDPCCCTRGMNCWRRAIDVHTLHAHALRIRRLYDAALHYNSPINP